MVSGGNLAIEQPKALPVSNSDTSSIDFTTGFDISLRSNLSAHTQQSRLRRITEVKESIGQPLTDSGFDNINNPLVIDMRCKMGAVSAKAELVFSTAMYLCTKRLFGGRGEEQF